VAVAGAFVGKVQIRAEWGFPVAPCPVPVGTVFYVRPHLTLVLGYQDG